MHRLHGRLPGCALVCALVALAGCASRPAPADATLDGPAPDRAPPGDDGTAPVDDVAQTDAAPDAPGAPDAPDDAAAADDAPPDPRDGGSCTGRTGAVGEVTRTIRVDGRDRRFLLHVPSSYVPTRPTMLVFNFHGFTSSGPDQERITHLFTVADERGFIGVAPDGVSGSWNGGACCGVARTSNIDDVGFVRAMIDLLEREYCVDRARVFAMGFSNGGFLSHRLGCELSDRIAAIGPVAGQMSLASCTPGRPVPVAMVHGTLDFIVPYGGNPVLGYPSTATTIMGWVTRNGCGATPREVYREGRAHCDEYSGCARGADVVLCTVDNLDHSWPGGGSAWSPDGGRPMGFVATDFLVDFFERHPRP